MTEEEMLRRGPMCKDCHKEHFGQVCPCNKCGWIHPYHGCLDRSFTPEEIPTITEIPPKNSQVKEIKLTVPIKGEHWCWLYNSHSPEKICPRKDEIDTEYGRQRLKELLQEMVKPQERLGVELDRNGATPEVDQEAWLLETPLYSTGKGELIGPKIVQLPQGKTPHIKPVELGGVEPSGHLNQQPLLHQNIQVMWWDNPLQNFCQNQLFGGVELGMIKRKKNSCLGTLLEGMVVEEVVVMVMVVVVEMMMIMMRRRRRTKMMKMLKQSLKVKMRKNKMHQEEEVKEVMNHHLIQGVEMWDLEVEGDTEVKEDDEVGQVHRVYWVHRGHRDLRALRV